jgi:hypothetical protein
VLKILGRQLDEPLREQNGGLVGEPTEHDVRHAPQLPAHGRIEHGVAIAVDGGPPRRHAVDQLDAVDRLAAVGQAQTHTLCGYHRQRR